MSKRIFLDTNIVLDYLSIREPFFCAIAGLITLADKSKLTLVVSPISFATLNYILSRHEGASGARDMLRLFRTLCHVSTVDNNTVDKALASTMKDFEDALQYFSALTSDCDLIITRDGKGFLESVIPVMTANEFLEGLKEF